MSDDTQKLSDAALDIVFRQARSYDAFAPDAVTDEQLRAIHDVMKHGPTTSNSQPQRIVFLRSAEAKQRLAVALSNANRGKTLAAPVVAIFAYDLNFSDHLDRFYHVAGAKHWYTKTAELRQETALRNATLQAAYFMLAARAIGLDCGPMSGFDNAKVDAEFFPDGQVKSNFLCNLGKGDASKLSSANPRFRFDEVCRTI
jgi:3-hydroxypropanoate dehydrogenase